MTRQNFRPTCQAHYCCLELYKAKDVKDSVLFHSATVETCVEMISCCLVVCQFVPYATSNL